MERTQSQNVNFATCAILNTYTRHGFECKDFASEFWLKKPPSNFFLKAEEMEKPFVRKTNIFTISNIQNTEYHRILKIFRLEKTFKMTKSKYQPSITTMSTTKPCLQVLCPDVAPHKLTVALQNDE